MRSNLRRRLLASSVLFSVVGVITPTSAQDAAGPADESQIVVTGTRVARPDLTANSPVSVIGADTITSRNVVTVDQILNESPQFTPNVTPSTNNGNPGAATIDLRNLGSQRTLVLVDGKRMAAYDVSGSVDLNTIPTQLVQRVDVLTGGASAVYGSDAVAGVVNFVLKKDFEGLQADGSWSQTEKGDGTEWNIALTAGANFAGGRGNITVSGSYLNREAVTQDRRAFSRVNLDSIDFTPSGSSNAVPTVIDNSFLSTGADQYQFVQGGNTVVPFYQPYNFNPVNLLQVPQKRYAGTILTRFELTPEVEFFARGTYVKTKVTTILAPTATFGFPFDINPTNPFLSAQFSNLIFASDLSTINPDGTTTIGIRRRMVELGGRQTNFDNDLWQVVGGFRGELGADWKWEVFAQNASVVRNQLLLNDISYSRVQQALLVVPTGTGPQCTVTTGGCVPLNLFTSNPISPAALAFITRNAQQRDTNKQFVAGGSINGSPDFLTSPWASKSGGVAFGFEYRREKGESTVDANFASGDLIGYGQGIPVAPSSYNVKEFYAEWLQPIIQDRPFFHDLSLESGYRYSKYDSGIAGYSVGGVHTFKAGGSWAPVEDLRFRGLFQRAVRAPNLFELTFPITSGTDNLASDPCAGTNPIGKPTVIAKCIAQGAPSALVNAGVIIQPIAGQVNNFTGGNPNLDAEVSNTWTVGFVTQPKFLPGFSLSADYFSVAIKNAIVPFGGTASNVVDACFNLNDAFACSQIKRNTVTGSLSGGTTVGVSLTNQNAALLATSGIDIASSYRFDAFGGKFGLNFFGTYLKKYTLETFDVSSCAGQFGFECGEPLPKWKHTFDVDYDFNNGVGVSARWRMIGSVTEDAQTAIAKSSIPIYNYFDLSASWDLNKHFTLRGGISNLINTKPPVVGGDAGTTASNSGNTFPNTYDTLGRTFFIGVTGKL